MILVEYVIFSSILSERKLHNDVIFEQLSQLIEICR